MASWWYCLKHGAVEEEHACALSDRLGPYATREDAAAALERARQRTEEEDERDRRDREWGAPPGRW